MSEPNYGSLDAEMEAMLQRPVTAPTPDAVAQAKYELDRWLEAAAAGSLDVDGYVMARDALIAAVRAECAATTRPSVKRLNFLANLAFEHPHVRLRLNGGEWTLDTGNATIGRGRTCNDAIDSAMEAQP